MQDALQLILKIRYIFLPRTFFSKITIWSLRLLSEYIVCFVYVFYEEGIYDMPTTYLLN
jgi:hypothetical protein